MPIVDKALPEFADWPPGLDGMDATRNLVETVPAVINEDGEEVQPARPVYEYFATEAEPAKVEENRKQAIKAAADALIDSQTGDMREMLFMVAKHSRGQQRGQDTSTLDNLFDWIESVKATEQAAIDGGTEPGAVVWPPAP